MGKKPHVYIQNLSWCWHLLYMRQWDTADKLLTLTEEDCPFQRVYKKASIMTSLHPRCNCIQEGLQWVFHIAKNIFFFVHRQAVIFHLLGIGRETALYRDITSKMQCFRSGKYNWHFRFSHCFYFHRIIILGITATMKQLMLWDTGNTGKFTSHFRSKKSSSTSMITSKQC